MLSSGRIGRARRVWRRMFGCMGSGCVTRLRSASGICIRKPMLEDGSEANVIAWIWARTVTCPNPACGATMPLAQYVLVGEEEGQRSLDQPDRRPPKRRPSRSRSATDPKDHRLDGTVGRSGARCLVCGTARSDSTTSRAEGDRAAGVETDGDRRRGRPAAQLHRHRRSRSELGRRCLTYAAGLDTPLPTVALGFRVQAYGMRRLDGSVHRPATCHAIDLVRDLADEARRVDIAAAASRTR